MYLSVVVPCKNEVKYIERAVSSLLNIDTAGHSLEVIIVDGNSTDGTIQTLREKFSGNPNVKLFNNPKEFTPAAFNIGIREAQGKYVLIAGARHRLAKDYALLCIKDLEKDKSIGVVGGFATHDYEDESSKAIAIAMTSKFGVGGDNFRTLKRSGYVDTIGTPVYRKSIFNEIGLFDEDLIRNQDDELNYRLRRAGYKVWCNIDAKVDYMVRSNLKNLWKQYGQYGYWKVLVNKKHKTVTTFRQIIPALFIVYLTILPLLALVFPKFAYFFLIPLFIYFIILLIFSFFHANSIFQFLSLMKAFLVLHFSYGIGYLKGIVNFLILRKIPQNKMTQLTR